MKQYIKDGKIYNLPLEVKIGNETAYTNNEKFLKENGYEEYIFVPTPYKPTLEEEIENSVKMINEETDNKIMNYLVWKGNELYITTENQFNLKNLYDLRNMKEYPVTIKTKTGFTTLENEQQVEEFYLEGVRFVEECIQEGWQRKSAAEAEIREKYK